MSKQNNTESKDMLCYHPSVESAIKRRNPNVIAQANIVDDMCDMIASQFIEQQNFGNRKSKG